MYMWCALIEMINVTCLFDTTIATHIMTDVGCTRCQFAVSALSRQSRYEVRLICLDLDRVCAMGIVLALLDGVYRLLALLEGVVLTTLSVRRKSKQA